MVELKRKIYKRGSSFETTIPMPLLFALDLTKKQNILFKFDNQSKRWYIEFEEASSSVVENSRSSTEIKRSKK
jgi:hypothetical protein